MDHSYLDDLNPFDIFDAEAERLDRFFASLTEAQWNRPTRCEGWSVRDVLAHLAGEEAYNHACLEDDLEGFLGLLEREGVHGFHGFNDWCVRVRRDKPVEEVLEEWRGANSKTRAGMRSLGREGLLQTSVGPYPAVLQTFHYDSEYATHGDDVGVPVDADERPDRTSWRARFGRFALSEKSSPVEIEETNDGAYNVRLEGLHAKLSESDFVEATVARLPDDHPLDRRLRAALVCLA